MSDLTNNRRTLSLEELNSRAALPRRVDNKYVVPLDTLERAAADLSDDYRVLEIDGRRSFGYDSVYFDTPDLLCFRQHVEGTRPRFKARSRLYTETGVCFFEVKLKTSGDETLKRRQGCRPDQHGRLDSRTRAFIDEVLASCELAPAAEYLEPTLNTRFSRTTFAADDGAERVTCDSGVHMSLPDGRVSRLREGLELVETKSEAGEGAWDSLFARLGLTPVSLSKYRLGIALLAAHDPDNPLGADVDRLFETA